jgi:hypothetical protein
MKEIWNKYYQYFIDIWQYLAILIAFILGAVLFL